ncbi:MAG: serine hydrolase domain-containing protein [Arenimonas sp.]
MKQLLQCRILFVALISLSAIVLSPALLANPATATSSESYPEIKAATDTLSNAGFQGVILIKAGDLPPQTFSHGSASCKKARPFDGSERFDMGSITKSVTAAAVLRLVERGDLTLETRLGDVLHQVPANKADITVKQLLMHTSGLPDSLGEDESYISKPDFLTLAFAAPREILAEGDDVYSNAGYSLLAAEIEQITGRRYEDAVRELVLAPAGVPGINYVAGNRARNTCGLLEGKRWGSTRDYFTRREPSWYLVGNGGMLATPTELAAFFEAIWKGDVLNPESLVLFDKSVKRTDKGGRPVRVASGSNLIFTSLYFNWPDQKTTVVIMTSDSRFPKEKVTPGLYPAIVKVFERLTPQ